MLWLWGGGQGPICFPELALKCFFLSPWFVAVISRVTDRITFLRNAFFSTRAGSTYETALSALKEGSKSSLSGGLSESRAREFLGPLGAPEPPLLIPLWARPTGNGSQARQPLSFRPDDPGATGSQCVCGVSLDLLFLIHSFCATTKGYYGEHKRGVDKKLNMPIKIPSRNQKKPLSDSECPGRTATPASAAQAERLILSAQGMALAQSRDIDLLAWERFGTELSDIPNSHVLVAL